jgi:HD-like signal output (HDOD) protein
MASKSHVIEMQLGDELLTSEEHRWLLYLIEGKIDLRERGNNSQLITADDSRACHPLFTEKMHHIQAVAQTHCKVVRFDKQLFSTLLEQELITGEELETIEIGDIESNIFNAIMHAFNVGRLKLPSLPEVALKVKTAVSDPNVNLNDVARIVESDPAMAARLIQVVNSPVTRGLDPVRSIKDAIVRLGLVSTRNLVMSYSVKQLFKAKSTLLQQRMKQLYEHSVEVAAISFALANESRKFSGDQLLLAGLIHDIGVIPILAYIDETGLDIDKETELDDIVSKLRGIVGGMVIKHWGFSSDMQTVVEHCEDWHRDSGEKLDICDMVLISQVYSMLQHKDVSHLPKIHEVPAFKKLFPEKQDPEFALHVFEQAQDEIAEVKRLLRI